MRASITGSVHAFLSPLVKFDCCLPFAAPSAVGGEAADAITEPCAFGKAVCISYEGVYYHT